MTKIKTAVVGVGALGRHHLRWLHQLEESELVGLYDTDRDRAAQYAAEYNVTAFESLEALAGQVEAVTIVVPTSAHFQTAAALLERKIHCLIEKPVTSTLDEARRLQQLANGSGRKVTVGHIERFNPAVLALAAETIRPSFIEGHRLAAFDPRGTDVAVVLDLMIHDLDLVLMLVKSDLIDIQASGVAVISDKLDIANARLTFANGAVANLTASRISLQAMRKLRIFQRSGYFSLDLAKKQADFYRLADADSTGEGMRLPLGKSGQDLLYRKIADSGDDMLGGELRAFLKAIRDDRPVAVSLEESSRALEVALQIKAISEESARRMGLPEHP
jgi:predicted dehydrogenase